MKSLRKQIIKTLAMLNHRGWSHLPEVRISVKLNGLPQLTDFITDQSLRSFPLPQSFPQLAGDYFLMTRPGLSVREIIKKPDESILLLKCAENGTTLHLMGVQYDFELSVSQSLINHLRFHEQLAGTLKNTAIILAEPNHLINLSASMKPVNAFSPDEYLTEAWPPAKAVLDPAEEISLQQVFATDASGYKLTGHLPGVVLWEKHGAFVAARKLPAALTLLEVAEKAARIASLR